MNREDLLKIAKPILFSTEMVRAVLEGRKIVTRRAIKLDLGLADTDKNDSSYLRIPDEYGDYHDAKDLCRYQVGDILYVRETHCPNYFDEFVSNKLKCAYKADWNPKLIDGAVPEPKWKPSIHMKKEFARIFLKVIDIRVERLQNIDFQDIKNEGIKVTGAWDCVDYLEAFEDLWNSTVKKQDLDKYGWYANPFVWVIEFERLEIE